MAENYHFDTLAVHAGFEHDPKTHTATLPIYATNAYEFESAEHARRLFTLEEPGNIYSRLMNPTVDALERRVAALEGGVGALAMASGHSAVFSTMLALAGQGDEIVSSINIYGGAINLLGVTLRRIGINVKFVQPNDPAAWEAAVTDRTKAFFVEVVGNPNADVADLEMIAGIAHAHGIPFIADSTFTTPYLIRPADFGADIVIHSATKFLGGHGTVMGGIIVDTGKFCFKGNSRFPLYNEPDVSYHGIIFADVQPAPFVTRLRVLTLRDVGGCLSPFNAFMLEQGIETLSLRMRRHCDNAQAVAEFLAANPAVSFVNFPGLPGNKYHELAKKYLPLGCGSVFTFGLKGGREVGSRFIDSLRLVSHVANVGDVRTIVTHPASTTHSQLSDEQLKASGITPETVRISVGIEDVRDIIEDMDQAIKSAVK